MRLLARYLKAMVVYVMKNERSKFFVNRLRYHARLRAIIYLTTS